MNATTNAPTKLVTTIHSFCRASAEFGAEDYTTTETLHADGRIETHCVGYSDGSFVDERGSRYAGKELDLAKIAEGRRGMGYCIVSLS